MKDLKRVVENEIEAQPEQQAKQVAKKFDPSEVEALKAEKQQKVDTGKIVRKDG